MKRRDFLRLSMLSPLGLHRPTALTSALPGWRTFEINTQVTLPVGIKRPARVWLPTTLTRTVPFQVEVSRSFGGNSTSSRAVALGDGSEMIAAEWTGETAPPQFELTMRVATTAHRVALDGTARANEKPANLHRYLQPTTLIPTDGIVRDTAMKITRSLANELSRARAIYDWIVENTARDPEVQGCGLGDVRWMLETSNLRGKCADLNALFVGLCRAAGLPARDLYGIRLAPSSDFPSLGRAGGNITTAQHCRAEVYVDHYGWVPVDPADVRKVILEERPQAPLTDPHVVDARERLFGSWEMNWIAFNDAHDVVLPGSTGKPLPFLMYPQAEVDGQRRDSFAPEGFRYTITAKEIL
jgi:transglutaminase-like putative cysteine protease